MSSFCTSLNFSPRKKQKEFLESFALNGESMDVDWGRGEGKTTATVVASLWWLLKHPYSLVITTCPTLHQSKLNWMYTCRHVLEGSDPRISGLFSVTAKGIIVCGCKWYSWGLRVIASHSPEIFQGIFNNDLLIVCDEYLTIRKPVMDTIMGYHEYGGGVVLRTSTQHMAV